MAESPGEVGPNECDGPIVFRHAWQSMSVLDQVDLAVLGDIVRQTRQLIRYVDTARDAALLVRRANAVERLVGEALKSCRLLEEQQFDLKQEATEAHLRTQRRAGELLRKLLKNAGGRPAKTRTRRGSVVAAAPTLRQLGIDRHESYRWQRIAALPLDTFEEHIAGCRKSRKELTTSGVVQLATRVLEGDADDPLSRPSAAPALLMGYEQAKHHASEMIWLDPFPVAAAMSPDRRSAEIEFIQRLRIWLDEVEIALRAPSRSATITRSSS